MLLALSASSATLYVDVNSSNPTPPYSTLSTAATSIQNAVDAATNGDLVLVQDGVYQTGYVVTLMPGGTTLNTNRVVIFKNITVQSLHGPAAACINGSGIYRCVYLTNGAALIGFTLSNGLAGAPSPFNPLALKKTPGSGGGLYGSRLFDCMVSNCVFVDNVAYSQGGGAYSATVLNSRFIGNSAVSGGGAAYCQLTNCLVASNTAVLISGSPIVTGLGGGVLYGAAVNCLVSGNQAATGGGSADANLVNCTVINNSASYEGGVATLDPVSPPNTTSYFTNCIIYSNTATNSDNNYSPSMPNYFSSCCIFPLPSGLGNFSNAPAIVDLSGGDYHLQSNSPCINSGNNAVVTTSTDLDGNPRIAGGSVDIGAYEYPAPTSVLSYLWAQQYGFPTDGSADFTDPDGDGMNNWQEFIAGTNPTNAASVLAMTSARPVNSQNWVSVRWQSVNTRSYSLFRSTNLAAPSTFSLIQSAIAGQTGTTTFVDTTTATNGGPYFYRVRVP